MPVGAAGGAASGREPDPAAASAQDRGGAGAGGMAPVSLPGRDPSAAAPGGAAASSPAKGCRALAPGPPGSALAQVADRGEAGKNAVMARCDAPTPFAFALSPGLPASAAESSAALRFGASAGGRQHALAGLP